MPAAPRRPPPHPSRTPPQAPGCSHSLGCGLQITAAVPQQAKDLLKQLRLQRAPLRRHKPVQGAATPLVLLQGAAALPPLLLPLPLCRLLGPAKPRLRCPRRQRLGRAADEGKGNHSNRLCCAASSTAGHQQYAEDAARAIHSTKGGWSCPCTLPEERVTSASAALDAPPLIFKCSKIR